MADDTEELLARMAQRSMRPYADDTPYHVRTRDNMCSTYKATRRDVDRIREVIDPIDPDEVKWFEIAVVAVSESEQLRSARKRETDANTHLRADNKYLLELSQRAFRQVSAVTRRGISPAIRAAVIGRDGKSCRACGKGDNLHIDHIHPVVAGGLTVMENLQVLCRRCNSSKGARDYDEWIGSRVPPLHNGGSEGGSR